MNFANEKLQQHFNLRLFKLEQGKYINAGIDWAKVGAAENIIFNSYCCFSGEPYPKEKFKKIMRAVQCALILASILPVVLSFRSFWRIVARFLSPLSSISLVSPLGFGLYDLSFPGVAKCGGIELSGHILLIFVSQHVPHVLNLMDAVLKFYAPTWLPNINTTRNAKKEVGMDYASDFAGRLTSKLSLPLELLRELARCEGFKLEEDHYTFFTYQRLLTL